MEGRARNGLLKIDCLGSSPSSHRGSHGSHGGGCIDRSEANGVNTETPFRDQAEGVGIGMGGWMATWSRARQPIQGCRFPNLGSVTPQFATRERMLTSGWISTRMLQCLGVVALS